MSTGAKYVTALVVGVLLLFAFSASCSGDGEEYYHVPGVSVDVDKRKAPSAPKFGTSKRR